MILVDSSVWLGHIRAGDPSLATLLNQNRVLTHAFVIGEAEIETMAAQLAALRGQSTEEVVALALRAELARERKQRPAIRPAEPTPAHRGKVQRGLELVRAARPAFGEGGDRTAFLYDGHGLPK